MKIKDITLVIISIVVALSVNTKKLIPNRTPLTTIEPAIVLALDREEEDLLKLTVLLAGISDTKSSSGEDKNQGNQGGGQEEGGGNSSGNEGGTPSDKVLSETGKAIATIVEKLQKTSSKAIPAGDIEFFLIGEELVKWDIFKFTDFLAKDPELRLTSKIYFIKGDTAENVVKEMDKNVETDKLLIFSDNSGIVAYSYQMEFIEFLEEITGDIKSFVVPTIEISEKGILIEGYAIMTDGKFSGYISNSSSRGYNILKNLPVRSTLEIEMEDNYHLSLSIENSKTQIEFKFDKDKLKRISIVTNISYNIQDIQGLEHIDKHERLDEVKEKATDLIAAEIKDVLSLVREYKSDFLGMHDICRMKHPYRWDKMKDNWKEIISDVELHVEVISNVQGAYDMTHIKEQ